MKHLALRLCVALVTFAAGTTVGKLLSPLHLTSAPATEAEQEVLTVERAYIDAHLRRDTTALDRVLADDFTFYLPYGAAEDKAERLALISDPGFAFTAIDTDNVQVSVSGDAATVTGRARVHVMRAEEYERSGDWYSRMRGGTRVSPWYNYVRNYEQRDGRWQVVSVRTMRLGCR